MSDNTAIVAFTALSGLVILLLFGMEVYENALELETMEILAEQGYKAADVRCLISGLWCSK